jgi:tagatose-6-phosphate ketose/aldose isomerase
LKDQFMTYSPTTPWATFAEIAQQPDIWRQWSAEFSSQARQLAVWIAVQNPDEIWLCGAGSSAFVGDMLAAHFGSLCRVPVRAIASTDLVADPAGFLIAGLRPLVVSFGRSGNSAETLGSLDHLDALAPTAPRLNITCNAKSVLATRTGDSAPQREIILPDACHDKGFAMTSSFSTMLLSAAMVLDAVVGDVEADGGVDVAQELTADSDADAAAAMLGDALAVAAPNVLSAALAHAGAGALPDRVVFLGAGVLMGAAREAALKVMELAAGAIPALWDTPLGFRHGPKSFVLPGTRIYLFQSANSYSAQYETDLTAELRTQFGADCVVEVGPNGDIATPHLADPMTGALLPVLAAQALAAVWSDRAGLNVDDPFVGRGTLTRVVADVRLYPAQVQVAG